VKLYSVKLYCPAIFRYPYDFEAFRGLADPSVYLQNNAKVYRGRSIEEVVSVDLYLVRVNRVQLAVSSQEGDSLSSTANRLTGFYSSDCTSAIDQDHPRVEWSS
jgi:hypothetical protein